MDKPSSVIKKIRIYTDGGNWEFEVGGTINDPNEFDWVINCIEVVELKEVDCWI